MGAQIANAQPAGEKNLTGFGPELVACLVPSRRPLTELALMFIAHADAVRTLRRRDGETQACRGDGGFRDRPRGRKIAGWGCVCEMESVGGGGGKDKGKREAELDICSVESIASIQRNSAKSRRTLFGSVNSCNALRQY